MVYYSGALHLKSYVILPNYKYCATLWLYLICLDAINKGAAHRIPQGSTFRHHIHC
jgi:hypothetical protein